MIGRRSALLLACFCVVLVVGWAPSLPVAISADVWETAVPSDNPVTPDKVALGKTLFFDKRLSADDTVSCATCHDPKFGFSNGKPTGVGVAGKTGARKAPTVLNAMFNSEQFWDGRADSLEAQAVLPIINPVEMAMPSHDAVVTKLLSLPDYPPAFQKVFGGPPTIARVGQALASFERTLVSGDAPFDRFISGDTSAISPAAKHGWELFNNQARCITCHAYSPSSPFFTDFKYHNIGVGMHANQNFADLARKVQNQQAAGTLTPTALDQLSLSPGFSELGRFLITRQPKDIGAFKTSTLRNIELTAPYMHDGSQKTLRDVLDFYNQGGEPNPTLDGGIVPLKLTSSDEDDLEAFLKTLTGDGARRLATGQDTL